MLNKKKIAIATAVATIAPVATPLVAMADSADAKKIVVSSGEIEKIEKIKKELERVEGIKYSNNKWAQNSQGAYYKEYTKFERNFDDSDQDVSIYRVERTMQGGDEVIKVTDRGHRVGFETEANAVVDFDEKGNNIPEKLVAEIVITTANNVNEYNVDAQLLYKTNGKYSEVGARLFHVMKDNVIMKEETVADGNKTGRKYTVGGNNGKPNFIVTIWGQPVANTEDSTIGSLAGLDRCETAAQVSQEGWIKGSADTVVLAGWDGTADALAATPLAASLDAPILLTDKTKVNEYTKAEIDRLKARNVIIVGGEYHVDNKVVVELEAMGLNVKRVAGEDRTRTSFEIAKLLEENLKVQGKSIDDVYIAGGYDGEEDALSIASHAGTMEQPILLVDKNRVADDVKIWMKEQKTRATIIGGSYAVDKTVEKELDGVVVGMTQRVEGSNVQETNAAVINKFHKDATGLIIAQDDILADALAAGPLAAKLNAPVVLGSKSITTSQTEAIRENVGVNKMQMGSKVFNVGHGVARSVVRHIENILTPKA